MQNQNKNELEHKLIVLQNFREHQTPILCVTHQGSTAKCKYKYIVDDKKVNCIYLYLKIHMCN